jgi:glycosyltransferase involved in cell wall biosynthesis
MTETPRVLEILGRSAGGVARHVADVVGGLDGREGSTVEAAGPPGLPIAIPNLTHEVSIPDGAIGGHAGAIRRLRTITGDGRYDVLHAHGLRAGVDTLWAARGRRMRAFVTLHNLALPTESPLRTFLQGRAERFVLERADLVLAPSVQVAEHLKSRSPRRADRVEVLHVAVAEPPEPRRTRAEIRTECGVPTNAGLIVAAARLAPQKDLGTLLRAVEQVDGAVLIILGEGPQEEDLRALATSLGIEDRVRFAGFRRDIHDFIRAADVLSLSSLWEGVALVAQEAVAVGTPVVSTNVGGIGELIEDGFSGRLVPPRDPRALATALRDTLASPDVARAFALRARAALVQNFDREKMLTRLLELYRTPADV